MAEFRFRPSRGVWHRTWRHQSIGRLRFSIRVLQTFTVYLVPFRRYSAFGNAENGRKTISAARGVQDRKWSHRSIAWPRFGICRFWNFSIIFYLSKVIRLFRCACKMPFENFGEGIFPCEKKFFIDETPTRHFLRAIRVVWDIVHPNRFSGLVCRVGNEKKVK
jgi:hypothetical protein